MEAHRLSETAAAPIQLLLRIRHPAIDPEEISTTLDLEPEHCFKAGDSRAARAEGLFSGRHTQSYWLAPVSEESWAEPIEPTFLAAIAARDPNRNFGLSAENLQATARNIRSRNVEGLLLHFLQRLNARHSFLQRIQNEGGDVTLIMAIERESAADFTLPVAVAGLLVQLGISIEFKFDT
jgi:hypothetical protein